MTERLYPYTFDEMYDNDDGMLDCSEFMAMTINTAYSRYAEPENPEDYELGFDDDE